MDGLPDSNALYTIYPLSYLALSTMEWITWDTVGSGATKQYAGHTINSGVYNIETAPEI